VPRPPGRRLKCKARSKRTGCPCKNWAVASWQVCRMHGARGGAPPEKLKGNINSLKTGAHSTVALTRFIAFQRVQLEAPITPEAILRNMARTTHSRLAFMYALWLQAAEDLERYDALGRPHPEALQLTSMLHRQSRRASGDWAEWVRQDFTNVFYRWLAINEAIDRLEMHYGRLAEQLREKAGVVPAQGTVVVVNYMPGVDESPAAVSA
jgi:hypothetical protein